MYTIGIDLGTTNSAAAYMKNGEPEIIVNEDGERTTPSVIQISEAADDFGSVTQFKLGSHAKDEYSSYPEQTIVESKRLMGKKEKLSAAGLSFTAEDAAVKILQGIKKSAEEKLGGPVTEAVITVPAYFTDDQRKATKRAGERAGFRVDRIINEPTAAALAFGMDHLETDQTIIVYDFGGGTFDVSIIEIFDGVIDVKATAGNNQLGGADFDDVLADWIVTTFNAKENLDLLQLGSSEEILQRKVRIRQEAEKVKKTLSFHEKAKVNIPFIAVLDNQPVTISLDITKEQFDSMTKHLVEESIELVQKALDDAGVTRENIDEVLLIGGTTRIPSIKECLIERFHVTPDKSVNPDEAVALGAAVQASVKQGDIRLTILDIAPYRIGIETVYLMDDRMMNGYFNEIIPRNSKIPISGVSTYFTVNDFQTAIDVNVYQSFIDNEWVEAATLMDTFKLEGIPAARAGAEPISIEFGYDINGILTLHATIVSTGRRVTKIISRKENDDVQTAEPVPPPEVNTEALEHLLQKAEEVLQEKPSEVRLEMSVLEVRSALAEKRYEDLSRLENELTDALLDAI
ncbi:2-alkenal reductase [Alkalicoccus urumqiensis]|uniref:Chaperone protein DnaK n=1 Tax=Alkalicoccus urumqiensis TaxID=1548213 RepID=A0A2P6MI01_ALKUR|nr:2-alkenal reductase [Alkalicoccus urumqiensis]